MVPRTLPAGVCVSWRTNSRSGLACVIRTHDLLVPNQTDYQAFPMLVSGAAIRNLTRASAVQRVRANTDTIAALELPSGVEPDSPPYQGGASPRTLRKQFWCTRRGMIPQLVGGSHTCCQLTPLVQRSRSQHLLTTSRPTEPIWLRTPDELRLAATIQPLFSEDRGIGHALGLVPNQRDLPRLSCFWSHHRGLNPVLNVGNVTCCP